MGEKRKTNKELLREAREEGLFKEAEEFSKRRKKYKPESLSDGILM